jgi:magnesium-transporting ATPase (P-type)
LVKLLLAGSALCSNARLNHPAGSSQWQEIGDPTEAALLVAALKKKLNFEELQRQLKRTQEVPFDSRRRMMSVVLQRSSDNSGLGFELEGQSDNLKPLTAPYLIFTKGSPLDVLQHCKQILKDGRIEELSAAERAEVTAVNDGFASRGYRVLGVATRQKEEQPQDAQELEQNLIFVGLVAMIDPPRAEVADAIAKCHQAGIQVTMVTGDYGLTAEAIAQQIGLVDGKARVVTGEEMGHLSDAQLCQILQQKSGLIFARVQPEQKLRLVQAYIGMGHTVAVTGDGVNDAPALRAANIGIAMGLSGTDVAREAADIVLIDDNFATIISAIEEGRAVYQNIRKFITYILSSNIPGLLEGVVGMIGFLLVWRSNGYGITELQGMTSAILARSGTATQMATYHQATTVTLAAIVACQVGNVFACRSERTSIFSLGFFSNRLIWLGIAVEWALILSIIYFPPLQKVFATAPLSPWQWLMLLLCPPLILIADEIRKKIVQAG